MIKSSEFFFLFCFCINFLWFVDCHRPLAFAMTNVHSSQWQRKQETVPLTSSLRGFEKAVAISVWSTMTVKQNSSLREFVELVAISVWGTIIYSWNSFSFYFCINFLWFVDCFASLAMTKGVRGGIHKLVIARLWKSRGNLVYSRLVIARTEGSWQSQYGIQLFIHGILFTIIYSWDSFYCLFLHLLFVACGGLPPFVRGEVAKQQGGWERNWKLKIEN